MEETKVYPFDKVIADIIDSLPKGYALVIPKRGPPYLRKKLCCNIPPEDEL